MSDKFILNADGIPVSEPNLLVWARWMQTADRKIVSDELPGDVVISTVFLGLDHSFMGGDPLLFETMIFGGEHDGYQMRYSTRAEAIAGHAVALEMAKGK